MPGLGDVIEDTSNRILQLWPSGRSYSGVSSLGPDMKVGVRECDEDTSNYTTYSSGLHSGTIREFLL